MQTKHFVLLILGLLWMPMMAQTEIDLFGQKPTKAKKEVLVAYFSVSGTTKAAAINLATAADADLWEIVPLTPYTAEDLDWKNPNSRSSIEMHDALERTPIKMCTDIRSYKTIYLGFPIWWGICPRIINSWIENNDLTSKKLIPFATSHTSSITKAVEYLRTTYPEYSWEDGKLLNNYQMEDLQDWVK